MYKTTFSEYDPATSIAPQCFLNAFENQLDADVKDFLKLCKDAHCSFPARLKLVTWKGMSKQNRIDNVVFKIKIMIGKY